MTGRSAPSENQGPMATTEFPDSEILRAYQLNLEGKAEAAALVLTPVVEHDPKEEPERLGAELCRLLERAFIVRKAELASFSRVED